MYLYTPNVYMHISNFGRLFHRRFYNLTFQEATRMTPRSYGACTRFSE